MDDLHTFLVRGPSSRFPRGYIWMIPIWFAVLGGVVVLVSRRLSGSLPLWLGVSEIGGLVLAGLVLIGVLGTHRRHAFRVSSLGIWLGVRTTRKRPKLRQVYIPWADVAQLRMVPRHYGTLVEITLGPSARIVRVMRLGDQAAMLLATLLMPVGFGRGRPALTAARSDPPRYLVKVCEVTVNELRQILAQVKPPEPGVPVLVPTGSVMRFGPLPRQRRVSEPRSAAVR
jgi:hypothetical protein